MKYYIYKIINKLNGKAYIGQHKIPKYKEDFRRYMGKGIAIREAIKKYGKENFDKIILEEIEDDEKHLTVSEREKFWIKEHNTMYPNGYNISPGGEGGCTSESAKKGAMTKKLKGYRHSETTRLHMSQATKGKKFSEEHKKHLSENHHLKTLHTIIFEDGHKEKTFESVDNISKRFNINKSTLIRYSAKQKFLNGIMLEGIDPNKYACCRNEDNSKDIVCKDPILNDETSLRNLRLRKSRNPDKYLTINPKDCII